MRMKINSIQNYNTCFKGATININAFSDTHGELLLANNALEELRRKQDDVFCKESKGKANILAICGDWFMDGGRKGYISQPDKPLAVFQLAILNSLIKNIKNIAPQKSVLFTPGNHEFDCKTEILDKILSQTDADIITSNLDTDNSPALKNCKEKGKLFRKKIIEVDDDKNPDLKHKVLVLGILPVNLITYQRNLDGISLTETIDKPQNFVEQEDYKKTLQEAKNEIREFKKENPNGIVMVMSHTGVGFADNLARESKVDLVFDGHEHRTNTRFVNGTIIIPLSQNFKKISNVKLSINDEGKLERIRVKDLNPLSNRRQGPLLNVYQNIFKKDIEKTYSISTPKADIKELSTQNIRLGNNFLANFVTDSILEELQKTNPEVDFFALNASSIRHPLSISNEPAISNFDITNVLAGIKEEEAKIMETEVTGGELAYMVADNFLFNAKMPQKNPLIHYSGLIIDRTSMMKSLQEGTKPENLTKYIIDKRTNKPIDPNKKYIIANPEKYYNKSYNPKIKGYKEKSIYTDYSVQELFKKHFYGAENKKLTAACDVRIK